MKLMNISEEAVTELKSFLNDNNIEDYNIRINLAGFGCSGPAFNIDVDTPGEGDLVEEVNGITFIAEKNMAEEFGGFMILSTEENEGRGLSLKPVIPQEGGCGSCGGGCHH